MITIREGWGVVSLKQLLFNVRLAWLLVYYSFMHCKLFWLIKAGIFYQIDPDDGTAFQEIGSKCEGDVQELATIYFTAHLIYLARSLSSATNNRLHVQCTIRCFFCTTALSFLHHYLPCVLPLAVIVYYISHISVFSR